MPSFSRELSVSKWIWAVWLSTKSWNTPLIILLGILGIQGCSKDPITIEAHQRIAIEDEGESVSAGSLRFSADLQKLSLDSAQATLKVRATGQKVDFQLSGCLRLTAHAERNPGSTAVWRSEILLACPLLTVNHQLEQFSYFSYSFAFTADDIFQSGLQKGVYHVFVWPITNAPLPAQFIYAGSIKLQ